MKCFSCNTCGLGDASAGISTQELYAQNNGLPTYQPTTIGAGSQITNAVLDTLTNLWKDVGQPWVKAELYKNTYGNPTGQIIVDGKALPVYTVNGQKLTVGPTGQQVALPPEKTFMEKYGMMLGLSAAGLLVIFLLMKKK